MKIKDWNRLEKADYDKWLYEYKMFMCNPENAYDCTNCPCSEDGGYNSRNLPCGQYRCHCKMVLNYIEEEEEA